jgi:ribose transport system permease protein
VFSLAALAAVILFFLIAEFVKEYRASGDTLLTFVQSNESGFASQANVRDTVAQGVIVAVAALGMTIVIISGGIDLSAGTALGLCAMVLAWCLERGWGTPLGVVACLAAGMLVGATNGALISGLKVAPFVVTLGTMTFCLGLTKWISAGTSISPPEASIAGWVPQLLSTRPQDSVWLLPLGAWLLFGLALLLALILERTVFSRHVFALGSSEATARLCGVNVPAVKIAVYALAGFFVGIAGLLQFSRLSQGSPNAGAGLELKIIAAVVIGGGSLSGGRGSVLGTLAGAAIISVLSSGSTFLEWSQPVHEMMIGAIIITAVTLDQFRQQRSG